MSDNSEPAETWEGEGGAVSPSPVALTGTPNQVEWGDLIRRRVSDDFDRVALAFQTVADKQNEAKRADTEAILAILEEKRLEVMSRTSAGYFIHDWQEIGGKVRQMIGKDPRYLAIKARK